MIGTMYMAGFRKSVASLCAANQDDDLKEYQYSCAWRLGQWDDDLEDGWDLHPSFIKSHSLALKNLVKDEPEICLTLVDQARQALCLDLAKASTESTRAIYESLKDLRLMREIELFANRKDEKSLPTLLEDHDQMPCASFSYKEPILLQRTIINRDFDQSLKYLDQCTQNGKIQLALNCLKSLQESPLSCTDLQEMTLQHREALILWKSEEKEIAKILMNDLAAKMESSLAMPEAHKRLVDSFIFKSVFKSICKFLQSLCQCASRFGRLVCRGPDL